MANIHIRDCQFRYQPDQPLVLNIPDLLIPSGQHLFVQGPSGSGKTTFLNMITGFLSPTHGQVSVLDTDITTLSPVQMDAFRAQHFGIIFQLFNLVPYLSVTENIIFPATFSPAKKQQVLQASGTLLAGANTLCDQLDLPSSLRRMPVHQLSIGQQQRVAIARALFGNPSIIVADEPTSALDHTRKEQFMQLLLQYAKEYRATVLFVSHDTGLAHHFDAVHALDAHSAGVFV